MQYRKLGKTGWDVSAVSMGCWAIGGQWGAVNEQEATATVHAALDAGVNLFDTADSYGLGQSEIFLGKALRGRRDGVYVASKAGNWARSAGDPPGLKSIYSIINCCHASLYRLGMDTIDLYQCHVGTPEHPEIFVEAFELLKQQGKIRHYAISTNDLGALRALDANGQCAACQINYSLFNRTPEQDLLPYCREHDIGVLLRGPIAQGLLADKFNTESTFSDTVRQKWNPGAAQRSDFEAKLGTVARLRPLLSEGQNMADFALQFTLANAAVTCPIPGMKSPAQARANAASAAGTLTTAQLQAIDSVCPPG
jgi:aryl-alcohol dehydrogenase-like predicted oxidoreductase